MTKTGRTKHKVWPVLLISLWLHPSAVTADGLEDAMPDRIEHYSERYALEDIFAKRTDNRGEGFEELYGTRNFRTILKGVAYRGGANNKLNRHGRRDNRNPLPEHGLVNLCEEGFERSYYLYRTNYETAPKEMQCRTPSGDTRRLDYLQLSPFDEEHAYDILRDVHATITDDARGPLYLHCWNGWHASGLIAAKILRQFCGLGAEEAVAYWDRNTDGHNAEPRYERIRQRIRDFEPYPELDITEEQAAAICP
ncbi:MAG: hypothetical protein P8172_15615 [Gammaproteobacteria bacterium]|jgi:hypothetical protein